MCCACTDVSDEKTKVVTIAGALLGESTPPLIARTVYTSALFDVAFGSVNGEPLTVPITTPLRTTSYDVAPALAVQLTSALVIVCMLATTFVGAAGSVTPPHEMIVDALLRGAGDAAAKSNWLLSV